MGSSLGSGRSSGGGNGHPLQYFCWKILWAEQPGGLQSMGSHRVALTEHRHECCLIRTLLISSVSGPLLRDTGCFNSQLLQIMLNEHGSARAHTHTHTHTHVCIHMYLFKFIFSFSSDKHPEVELLDHMVALFLIFEKLPYYFPQRLCQFT